MTQPATPRRAGPFNGNGVTTSFPFSFKVFDEADIAVVFVDADGIESPLVLSSDYSVTLNPDQEVAPGGAVTYPVSGTPLALGETLSIVGALPYDQVTDLPTGGSYRAQVVENALDRTVMQIQQLAEIADRTLTLPASVDPDDVSAMLPTPEALHLIGWNETATALQNVDPTTLATIVAFGTAQVDLFSGDGVQTDFVLTDNPGVLGNLDVAVDGVTQRPGIDFTWDGGTTLTFIDPPSAGTDNVLARYMQGLPQGVADLAASDLYGQSGAALFKDSVGRVVDSVADLKALSLLQFNRAFVTGYYAAGDGGGGQYYYDAADTLSADNGGTVIVAADGGRWKLVVTTTVSIRQFGAKADLSFNSSPYVQAAITWAQTNTKALYVPGGGYLLATQLTISARLHMFGDGMWQSMFTYSGAAAAIKITPPTAQTSNTGYYLHDFGVQPSAPGGGTYGVEVVLGVGAYLSNSEFAHLYVGNFANYGLRLDNSVGNMDGFFTLTFRRNWITNGINGDTVGDSVTIRENTITGSLANKPGITISGLSGARQLVIQENNITTTCGTIFLIGCEQAQILYNQLEHPASVNYNGALPAEVYLLNCLYANVEGNTIGTGVGGGMAYAAYAIGLSGTSKFNCISKNNIAIGASKYVLFDAAAINNILKGDNSYYFGILPSDVAQSGVDNAGIDNVGVDVSQTLLNGWAQYDATSFVTGRRLESAGEVLLRGAIKNGTTAPGTVLLNLPVGFRPTREKRFSVPTFNGATYSQAYLSILATGDVTIISGAQTNLLQLDGVVFTTS